MLRQFLWNKKQCSFTNTPTLSHLETNQHTTNNNNMKTAAQVQSNNLLKIKSLKITLKTQSSSFSRLYKTLAGQMICSYSLTSSEWLYRASRSKSLDSSRLETSSKPFKYWPTALSQLQLSEQRKIKQETSVLSSFSKSNETSRNIIGLTKLVAVFNGMFNLSDIYWPWLLSR